MVCVNCIVNPFVYVVQYHEFQDRMKEIFCGKKRQLRESGTGSTVTTDTTVDFEANKKV